jgi:hypothetical protein
MSLSRLQLTRRNTVPTSNGLSILRRKHARPISFHVSSDICSRLLGACPYLTSAVAILISLFRKHAKVSGEGAHKASNISDTEIEAAKQEWADLVLSDED